jgi:hypothetical protein
MINKTKNTVKNIQSINTLQLTLTEKNEIKNSVQAPPDLVISQSSQSREETYVRKFNPIICAKHNWLNGCANKNNLFGLLINHKTIPAPA